MPNIELLRKIIENSGMTKVAVSSKAGILRETLYNRLNGNGEFKASEIASLTEVLGLSKEERDAIFFGE